MLEKIVVVVEKIGAVEVNTTSTPPKPARKWLSVASMNGISVLK